MDLPATNDPQFDQLAEAGFRAVELASGYLAELKAVRAERDVMRKDLLAIANCALARSTDESVAKLAYETLTKYQ